MNIALAVSTMNKNIIGIENNYTNINTDININICHQNIDSIITNNEIEEIKEKLNYRIFSMSEKGLSKSRNCLLNNSTEDILIISDDDVKYVDNLLNVIEESYRNYPEADIITFQIKTPDDNYYKNYEEKPFWHTKKTILKVSSIEITVKRKSIISKELQFDENFGLGSTFPTGEEAIFLNDSLNKGLKILYVPIHISTHPIESSGKQFNRNISLIEAKGALLFRLYKKLGYIASILFAIKKYKLSDQSLLNFVKIMFDGIKKYRFLKKEKNAK
jgi:hypothetical protein